MLFYGFIIVGLVTVASTCAIIFLLDKRQNDAKIINMAGMQRALSQKITKNIYVSQLNESKPNVLSEDAKQFMLVHNAFLNGDTALNISKLENKEADSILNTINVYQKNIYHLATLSKSQIPSSNELNALKIWEGKFLAGMDEIVHRLELDASNKIKKIQYFSTVLGFATLTFSIILFVFFIKPIFSGVKTLNEEKKMQKDRLKSILENTPNAIWSVDTNFVLLAHNSAFTDFLRDTHTKPIGIGESLEAEIPMQSKKQYYKAFNGQSFRRDIALTNVDGNVIHSELYFNPIYNQKGEVTGCSIYKNDITERVRIFENLKKSEESLKEAQEIGNIGNWDFDVESERIIWSNQLYKVFGQDEETFKTDFENLLSIIHPDDRQAFQDDVTMCLERKKEHDIIYRVISKEKEIRYVHGKGIAFFKEDGTPFRMIGTTQNVTEREEIKQKLIAQYNELQNFVYIISHNVRSPIATLQALTYIFDEKNTEVNSQVIENIRTTVNALDQTIIDLNTALNLQDISELDFTQVDLKGVLSDIELLMAKQISESKAKIITDLSEAPTLPGIKSYYTNILYNLINNAISYRSEKRTPIIKISTRKNEAGEFVIRVSDNGMGMNLNNEKRKKIFDMYGRLSGKTQGKGMGLYLVKTQVSVMNGSINVESKPDEGSIFTINLKNKTLSELLVTS
ncbi:PAS domain-containing protein [Maribacter sp. 2210JD10-5]|uniref:PAS domain-containing protein n=1 Tax=Maribacter sp. 2210JD10-5 TaxID=3386272 RepID=UPI0039BC36AF